jgi:hypothetical protein
MKTTVKLLVSAVALCIVPVTYAITPEQAAANLQGAQQFSHLADKSYSTAMYNEHLANLAKGNAIVIYGQNSTEAINATQAYDAALKRVAQTRQEARLGRLQVNAANHALITATLPPVPTVNPTLYRQIIASQQAALIAPPVVNPVIPPQTGQPSVNTRVVLPGVVTSTQKQVINSYYVDQNTRNKVSNNAIAISQNNQRIDRNTKEIEITRNKVSSNSDTISQNSQKIDRNAKDIDDTRDDLKRGLNNAAAMSSLHYHSDNAWALSTGTANGDGAALAGGLQKGLTSHVAVNMQASTSFDSGWMAGAGISGDF